VGTIGLGVGAAFAMQKRDALHPFSLVSVALAELSLAAMGWT
jgi:hypothetical protein